MRILINSFTFPPNKDGVSSSAHAMAVGFLEKGWEVHVATGSLEARRENDAGSSIKIHEFNITGDGHPRRPFKGEIGEYRALLKDGDWDAMIFHSYAWPLYLAMREIGSVRARKILVSHGYNIFRWEKITSFPWGLGSVGLSIYRCLKMFFWINRFDHVVYLSRQADMRSFLDHAIAKTIGYNGIRVIPNGVDLDEAAPNPVQFRNDFGIKADEILFLCVSNYNRIKNQVAALRSFRMAAIPNSLLVFVGSEFNECSECYLEHDRTTTTTACAGRVMWLEKLDREMTLNAIATADVFVLSSRTEAQPIVLLEAMRAGTPWIATSVGCIPDIPGGICVDSEEEMGRQMVNLACNRELRHELGRLGRAAVEHTYNRNHYIEAYCELIANGD